MERKAFIIRAENGAALGDCADELRALARREGVDNFSVWGIGDLLLCYGEDAGDGAAKVCEAMLSKLDGAGLLAAPGTMRLMYHDIGVVRTDKSLIRHRVFCTRRFTRSLEQVKLPVGSMSE